MLYCIKFFPEEGEPWHDIRSAFQENPKPSSSASAAGSDAEKLIAYMVQVNQETTFLSMEPGEFEASYPVEKEASYLDSIAQSQDRQLLIAVTPRGNRRKLPL